MKSGLGPWFHTPKSTKKQRIRARALVKDRIRAGWLARAETCQKCDAACRAEFHHFDYSKPLHGHWLCKSCHMYAHWHPKYLDGLRIIKVPEKSPFPRTWDHIRRGPTGKARGRSPRQAVISVTVKNGIATELLYCGHIFEREDDGRYRPQRRCNVCRDSAPTN